MFDSVSNTISVSIEDLSPDYKGDYILNLAFTAPGALIYDLGIILRIFDVCFDSYFTDVPVLSKNFENYYVG